MHTRRLVGLGLVLVLPVAGALAARSDSGPAPIRIVATRTTRLVFTPPPPSRGPEPPEASIDFVDASNGLLASGPALANGWAQGSGRIGRTVDGGESWATVWRRRSVSVDWVRFVDREHAFAAGAVETVTGGLSEPSSPLLLRSDDGGWSWHELRPRVPADHSTFFYWNDLEFQFVTTSVGYAIAAPYSRGDGQPIIRTTDGGRHWTALRTPFAPSSVRFVTASEGYATGVPHDWRRCPNELFRTRDGGRTWHRVTRTCRGYDLWGIDVLDAQHIFVAGGQGYWTEDPRQAVLASSDGGRNWQTIYDKKTGAAGLPIVDIHFADLRHGWAVTGSCKMGANGPCGGDVLATSDGGRSWRATPEGGVSLATIGTRRAWATGGLSATVVWRTVDGGRSWQPLVRPEGLVLRAVQAAGASIVASSVIGFLRSSDAGQSWSRFEQTSVDPDNPFVIRPGLIAAPDNEQAGALQLSRDDGRTWTSVTVTPAPGDTISAIAFGDDSHGLVAGQGAACLKGGRIDPSPVYATTDGGRTFHHLADVPVGIEALALQGDLAVGTGFGVCHEDVIVSHDAGSRWQVEDLPRGTFCGSPALAPGPTILLACSNSLLVSRDGGTTWAKELTPKTEFDSLSASGNRIWATGNNYSQGAQTLWHSNDGGRSWIESWISPPSS